MVQSDISIYDRDAILTIFLLGTDQKITIPLEEKDELVYNNKQNIFLEKNQDNEKFYLVKDLLNFLLNSSQHNLC
ncbi:hypothetical protein D3C87_1424750 [compost metagenome]